MKTDEDGRPVLECFSTALGPDAEWDRQWAEIIVKNAEYLLKVELAAKGHVALWEALHPHLYKEKGSPCHDEIATRFCMTVNAVGVAAFRFRKRLSELIREQLRETVATQDDFDAEPKHFRNLFSPVKHPNANP